MATKGNAGCHCGQIRLRIDGDPVTVIQCHCKDCQKSTGGNAVLPALMPRDAVTVLQGRLSGFAVTGDSGHEVRRCFCPTCGTPVLSELAGIPTLLALKAGIWDRDPGVAPASAILTGSAPDWHAIPEGIPAHRGAAS